MGRALKKRLWSYEIVNIRDFGIGKHRSVDDAPCGGGHGMVMRPDVLGLAIDHIIKKRQSVDGIFYMSPKGLRMQQNLFQDIKSKNNDVIVICGHYEGIDERVIDFYRVVQISLGDFVLSGGEIAAAAFVEGVVRLLPDFTTKPESINQDSFGLYEQGLLEYPLYTKPNSWRGLNVPDVLLSGNHRNIEKWKQEQSVQTTLRLRPDIF